jgi:hypothetical protein
MTSRLKSKYEKPLTPEQVAENKAEEEWKKEEERKKEEGRCPKCLDNLDKMEDAYVHKNYKAGSGTIKIGKYCLYCGYFLDTHPHDT